MKLGRRHVIAILCLCSTMMAYVGRLNLSTAIVDMNDHGKTNYSLPESKDVCPDPKPENRSLLWPKTSTESSKIFQSTNKARKFDWDEKTQGIILGAFFYGYFFLQIVSGRMAEMFGPRIMCTVGLFVTGLINLLTPWLAEQQYVFITSRIIMGALQAMIFPSCYALISHWIPDNERSFVNSLAFIGGNIGSSIASSMSGFVCNRYGWPTVFYVSGTLVTMFSIVYFLLVRDDPQQDPRVSDQEWLFIQSNIHTNSNNNNSKFRRKDDYLKKNMKTSFPWRKLLTNRAILVGIFVHFTAVWSTTVWVLKIPDYIDRVLRVPLHENGMYTSAMMLSEGFSLFFGGMTADRLIKSGRFEKNIIRKAFQVVAQLGGAICLMFVPLANCNSKLFLVAMVATCMLDGFQSGGIRPLPLDLSNEFSATVFGTFNMVGMTNGFICPYIIGYILDSDPNNIKHQWWIVFYITIGIRVAGATVFTLFGKTDRIDLTNENTEAEIEEQL